MTQRYELQYQVPDDLLRRAMTSWAQPKRSWSYRLVRLGLLTLTGVLVGTGLGLIGAYRMLPDGFWTGALVGFYIGLGFWLIMHRRDLARLGKMGRAQLDKQGPTHAVYASEGVETSTRLGSARSTWGAYDQVIAMADATALRSGGVIYPIPHSALPESVDPATFHADLTRWQKAGQ